MILSILKKFHANDSKIDEKSNKNILIYYIEYATIKDSKNVKINRVNLFYLIYRKLNGYFEEINKRKYLTPVPTNESKDKIKKYEELWRKIRYINRSITKNSDHYDGKYMKIKFN